MNNKDTILIRILFEGEEHLISTYQNEYRSLMVLIRDKLYPDSFGECGGMGRCATCKIQLNHAHEIVGMDRNESSTLGKQGITDPSIRLSCQLLIDAALHNTTIVIVDNY